MYLNFIVNQFTNCKTILILLFSIALLTNIVKAQNLVPNPSFEEYTSCPTGQAQIDKAPPWFQPTQGTPDYYNVCATGVWPNNFGVPNNFDGFQQAHTGNAYSGLYNDMSTANFDNREYMEVKLLEPLKKGHNYLIHYYVCLTEYSICAIDMMGAYLSKDSLIDKTHYSLLNMTPQISNSQGNVLKDTLNWFKIEGEYFANGEEQFLTLGNFITNAQNKLDTLPHLQPGQGCQANYYIDDVSVICLDCPVDTTSPPNNLFIPDAFSPNGDGNNDKLFVRGNNFKELYFAVYDRWGEKVFETMDKNNGWDGTYKGKELSGAVFVYYCKGKYIDGKEFKQKGDVTLVR